MPNTVRTITALARKYDLDPHALIAVARGEGGIQYRRGAIGDRAGGGSYGPFQLYAQGALPSRFRGRPQAADRWAWSPQGIDYALRQMVKAGAGGLTGPQAVEAIIRKFERPADPDGSVQRAVARYGGVKLPKSGGGSVGPSTALPALGNRTPPAPGVDGSEQRREAALALLDFATSYSSEGRITPNSVARLTGAVSRLGTVQPPPVIEKGRKATVSPREGVVGGAVDKVLAAAHDQVGKPYVFGSGPNTDSFDCSDLVQWAYKQIGVEIPRVTHDQIKVGKPVKWGEFQPGDLIFSNNGGHVVMYVGGGKVIAAPYTGTVVQYQPVSRFKNSFTAARRIL